MAAQVEFPNEIYCIRALSWSLDNRICMCTDTAMKIMCLNCAVENCEEKVRCEQSSFPVNPEIFDIPVFTKKNHKFLLRTLSREEMKALTCERVLNPWKYQIETVPRTGFADADWSPLGADVFGRCILATLSQDYRLCLYTHNPSENQWSMVCDLTLLRHKQTRPELVLTSVDDYMKYKDWCYSIAVSAIRWSAGVYTDSTSCQKFMVLATGAKSGLIVLWRLNMPCLSENDCSVLSTIQPYNCQVSGLCWSRHSDLLLLGYIDGQIHAACLDRVSPEKEMTCSLVTGDSDLMKVHCMCVLEDIKEGVKIVLASKEHCVLAFQLDAVTHTLISQSHIFLDNNLPASGMSVVTKDTVCLMTHDSLLQKITVKIDANDVILESDIIKLNLGADTVLMCHGFCISPNRVFSSFITRPRPGYDHLVAKIRKTATKMYIRCLDDFNIGLHNREDCVSKLINSTGRSDSVLDVLDLYRQLSINGNYIQVDNKDGQTSDRQLKLKRYGMMVHLTFLSTKKEDELNEDIKKDIRDLSNMILARYIQTSVQNLSTTSETKTKKDSQEVISAMYNWLVANSESLQRTTDIDTTKQHIEETVGKTNLKDTVTCCVCSKILKCQQQQWHCDNGHTFDLCCKTLLPIEGVNYQTCSVCHFNAKAHDSLEGLSWLKQAPFRCTLCDSLMF